MALALPRSPIVSGHRCATRRAVIVIEQHQQAGDRFADSALVIGNLDGLHRGHQALIAAARATSAPVSVMTFEPHPSKVLAPAFAPHMLMTRPQKEAALRDAQVHSVLFQRFDKAFAKTPPAAFIDDVLLGSLRPATVVVGADFSFGHKGQGTVTLLGERLAAHGIGLRVPETVKHGGLVVSSSAIRQFLLEGRVEPAAALLGRPYRLDGVVVHGDARGRRIGFPTANLASDNELVPKLGVYVTRAGLADGRTVGSVTNIGLRPTFQGSGTRIEAHLLDFDEDLYDQPVSLSFVAHLRGEQKFDGPDALTTQIARDIAQARAVLDEAGR